MSVQAGLCGRPIGQESIGREAAQECLPAQAGGEPDRRITSPAV